MLDTFTREFIQSETRLPETDAEAKNVVTVVSSGIFSPNLKSGERVIDEKLFEDTYKPNPALRRYRQLVSKEELQAASGLSYREAKKMDRFSLLAMAACRTALDNAGLSEDDFRNCGIITGNMVGGWSFTEPQLRALHAFGLSAVSPYLASAWFPAAPQGQVTIHLGLKGFAKTITTDRAAGAQAIEMAIERLRNSRRGGKEFLLAGGVEAPITPFVEAALTQAGVATETVVEGAGYLLLTSMPAADAAGETKLGEYITFPLQYRKGFPSRQISNALLTVMERGKNLPFPEAVICNTAACGWIEAETTALLKMVMGNQMPPLLFPTRLVGDSLAASGPIAIGIGCELLRSQSKDYRSVLALTLGHQGGHIVWMYR